MKLSKTIKERAKELQCKCLHFNGVQNETCRAGVAYKSFTGGLPCLKFDNRKSDTWGKCEKHKLPTDAEALEMAMKRQAELEKVLGNMAKVAVVLDPIRTEYKGKDGRGELECPCCGSVLRWSIAAYNGHMRVHCAGKDCVSWIE